MRPRAKRKPVITSSTMSRALFFTEWWETTEVRWIWNNTTHISRYSFQNNRSHFKRLQMLLNHVKSLNGAVLVNSATELGSQPNQVWQMSLHQSQPLPILNHVPRDSTRRLHDDITVGEPASKSNSMHGCFGTGRTQSHHVQCWVCGAEVQQRSPLLC